MTIKGKVHCFFEQSGTFKNEFIKLGIPAEDYDIQNNFGETDHVIDLFGEIERAYEHRTQNTERSIFDGMSREDLIMAFFPCIYFESISCMYFSCETLNNQKKRMYERIEDAINRLKKRSYFHELLYKLCYIAERDKLQLIIENPATTPNYLLYTQNFFKPSIVDKNRMERGDYFKKPTAYWFFNREPTKGFTRQNDKVQKRIYDCKSAPRAGLCSEERSLISSDYARNFICDFILGKCQPNVGEPFLFDEATINKAIGGVS